MPRIAICNFRPLRDIDATCVTSHYHDIAEHLDPIVAHCSIGSSIKSSDMDEITLAWLLLLVHQNIMKIMLGPHLRHDGQKGGVNKKGGCMATSLDKEDGRNAHLDGVIARLLSHTHGGGAGVLDWK